MRVDSWSYPQAISEHGYEVCFGIRIWAAIVRDIVMGPYLLPDRLWFQRDGALAHLKKLSNSGWVRHIQEGGLEVEGQLHGLRGHKI
jgi:hypothetical protein